MCVLTIVTQMSLVKMKIVYDYYSNQRVTPFFIREEELVSLGFDEFKARLFTEVPYLNKIATSLRLAVVEDNLEVDLSPSYFNYQIKGLLEKEKTVTVKAFMFDSPGLPPSHAEKNSVSGTTSIVSNNLASQKPRQDLRKVEFSNSRAKRSLTLTGQKNDFVFDTSDSDSDSGFPVIPAKAKDQRILLPLERYAKKQQQTANDIQRTLQVKKQELAKCREKLNMASQQNMGNKATCGNCHLKLGHTKKSCDFSPCRSAYSCGYI